MILCSHLNSCWSGSKWDAHFIFITLKITLSRVNLSDENIVGLFVSLYFRDSCLSCLGQGGVHTVALLHFWWVTKTKTKLQTRKKTNTDSSLSTLAKVYDVQFLFCVFGKSQRQRQRLSLRQKLRQRQRQTQPAVFSALVKLECTQWLFCTFGDFLRTLQTHFR